jgi:hypothetical protein
MKNNILRTPVKPVFLTSFNGNNDDNVECKSLSGHSTNRLSMPLSCFELRHFEPILLTPEYIAHKFAIYSYPYFVKVNGVRKVAEKQTFDFLEISVSFFSFMLNKCKEVNTS